MVQLYFEFLRAAIYLPSFPSVLLFPFFLFSFKKKGISCFSSKFVVSNIVHVFYSTLAAPKKGCSEYE